MKERTVLFKNRYQARKVQIVLWVSLAVCALAFYAGWEIFKTFGLSPGDGGILRPISQRIAFGAFVASLGAAFASAMMLYASLYVLRVKRDGDDITFETMSPWGVGTKTHQYTPSQIGKSRTHKGRSIVPRFDGSLLAMRVNAPWKSLYVHDRRFPFLLDLQAEQINEPAIRKLWKET